jgi:hypothetical protein
MKITHKKILFINVASSMFLATLMIIDPHLFTAGALGFSISATWSQIPFILDERKT